MQAAEILEHFRAQGASITVTDTGNLRLSAPSKLPDELVKELRERKADVVRLLASPSVWDAETWREFYDERAGIAEHDGGLSRDDAERQAFECCVMEWRCQHPPPASGPERCAHCREPIGEPGRDGLPFLTGAGGHTWLHSDCHGDWTARRRAEAVAALAILGLRLQAGKS